MNSSLDHIQPVHRVSLKSADNFLRQAHRRTRPKTSHSWRRQFYFPAPDSTRFNNQVMILWGEIKLFDQFLSAHSINSISGVIWPPHTHPHLAKQLLQLSTPLERAKVNNERGGSGPRHALSIPGQGLSDHHYRLHSVRLCVELQPFAILWRNRGNLAPSSWRTGQSNYTVSTFLQALIIFSLEGQDETRAREKTR